MKEWVGMVQEEMTSFAKEGGYDGVCICGRKGWEKVLGLKPERTFFVDRFEEKDI